MACFLLPENDLHGEPTLDEILSDPIIRLIMERDGVDETSMRGQMDRIQRAYDSLHTLQ